MTCLRRAMSTIEPSPPSPFHRSRASSELLSAPLTSPIHLTSLFEHVTLPSFRTRRSRKISSLVKKFTRIDHNCEPHNQALTQPRQCRANHSFKPPLVGLSDSVHTYCPHECNLAIFFSRLTDTSAPQASALPSRPASSPKSFSPTSEPS